MNDSIRMILIRGIAGLLLSFGFATAYADNSDDQLQEITISPTFDIVGVSLADIQVDLSGINMPTIVFAEETPIERIERETSEFIVSLQSALDKTTRGIGMAWYRTRVNLEKETTCLAQNIYYEARGEDMAGQLAIALVTVNRLKTTDYPPTVCEIVFQRTKNDKGNWVSQFSWTKFHRKTYTPRDQEKWAQAMTIAKRVLDGGRLDNVEDITQGSMFYHAVYVHPKKWNKYYEKTVKIGNHIFFKSKKDVEYRSDPVVMASAGTI